MKEFLPEFKRKLEEKKVKIGEIGKKCHDEKFREYCSKIKFFRALKEKGIEIFKNEVQLIVKNTGYKKKGNLFKFR